MSFDAHCHTDCSDGNISIEDRIRLIQTCGFEAATITDHDFVSVEQVERARAAAGSLPFVSGIELSLRHEGSVVHLLGYFIDPTHAGLQTHMLRVQDRDRAITAELLAAFRGRGAQFELEDLQARSLHTFYSMQLVKRLANEVYDLDPTRLISAFLEELENLGLAYADMAPWPVEEAIALVHAAGGLAVLAHPGGREDAVMQRLGFLAHDERHLDLYRRWGLDGIEVLNPVHSAAECDWYERYADEFHLLKTSGSDCHGDDPYLGPALMDPSVPLYEGLYARMCRALEKRLS